MANMYCHSLHATSFAAHHVATRSSPLALKASVAPHTRSVHTHSRTVPAATGSSSAAVAEASTPHVSVALETFPLVGNACFVNNKTSFVDEHRVKGHEVGPDQKATMTTVAHILQEAAGNHAVGMWGRSGGGFANSPNMKDLIFVMTRLQIRVKQYPQWGDIVQVETWFQEEGRLSARRDYILKDVATGKHLVSATSTWVCINMATRKLSKLPEDMRWYYLKLTPTPAKSAIPKEEAKKKVPDLPEGVGPVEFLEGCAIIGVDNDEEDQGVVRQYQQARPSDIDMNGHVNNVAYLSWALNTVPPDVLQSHHLAELELEFKAECQAGDVVESVGLPLPSDPQNGTGPTLKFLHSLWHHSTGNGSGQQKPQELVRARTTWIPPPAAPPSSNGVHAAASTNGTHSEGGASVEGGSSSSSNGVA